MKKIILLVFICCLLAVPAHALSITINTWRLNGTYMTVQGSASGMRLQRVQLSVNNAVVGQQYFSGGNFYLGGNVSYYSGSFTAKVQVFNTQGRVVLMAARRFTAIGPQPPTPPTPPFPSSCGIRVSRWYLHRSNTYMTATGTVYGTRLQRIELWVRRRLITSQYVNSGTSFNLTGYIGYITGNFRARLKLINMYGQVVATERKVFGSHPGPGPYPPSNVRIFIEKWEISGSWTCRAKIEGTIYGRRVQKVNLILYQGGRRRLVASDSVKHGDRFYFNVKFTRLGANYISIEAVDNYGNVLARDRRSI